MSSSPDPGLDGRRVARFTDVLTPIGRVRASAEMSHKTLTIAAIGRVLRPVQTEVDRLRRRRTAADVSVFHEFHEPPYGGGNQFLLALVGEWERRGLRVEANRVSGAPRACLYNSFNFDF